jgi:superfamily II DNA/RNA helicase
MKFEELNVNLDLVKALKEQGITEPTIIQEKSIPMIKTGKDVVGISNTGSGKTIAFGIPTLEKVIPGKGLQALIMAPTRELAVQIAKVLQEMSKYTKQFVTTIYGGVAIDPQIENLTRADIVVGTPGRLLDHLNRRTLNLTKINMFILDEADKMVEMGFIEDIQQILDYTPKDRQILLFGATISDQIDHLKRRYMNEPLAIKTELQVKQELLKQYYYDVKQHEKFSLLVHLLKKENSERVMIFCSTRNTVDILTRNLRKQKIKADSIHGQMTQNKRLKVIEDFNMGKNDILVASAVAARGLDIKFVTHVINYDVSQDPEEYIHRIGRTARAGESGKAITLLSHKDYDVFNNILDRFKLNIDALPAEDFQKLPFEFSQPRMGRGNYSGGRNFGRGPVRGNSSGRGNFGNNSGGRSYGRGNSSSRGGNSHSSGGSSGGNSSSGRSNSSNSYSSGRSRRY